MWKLFLILAIGYVQAMSDDEVKAEFIKVIMKCTETHPVEMTELLSLQKLIPPTKTQTQCLLACAYKTAKLMNSKGEYDLAENYNMAQVTKGNNEKELANARKLADICQKVNEIKVKDGEKGCERAYHIFKCGVENAPKLGFKI